MYIARMYLLSIIPKIRLILRIFIKRKLLMIIYTHIYICCICTVCPSIYAQIHASTAYFYAKVIFFGG